MTAVSVSYATLAWNAVAVIGGAMLVFTVLTAAAMLEAVRRDREDRRVAAAVARYQRQESDRLWAEFDADGRRRARRAHPSAVEDGT